MKLNVLKVIVINRIKWKRFWFCVVFVFVSLAFIHFTSEKNLTDPDCFNVAQWGDLFKVKLLTNRLWKVFLSLTEIWYCSGDVLCGRIFEFSIRSEIRRGWIQIFLQKYKDWSQEGQFCEGRPPLAMPCHAIILNGSMYKWNPASGILNELSDCIL